MRKGFLLSSLVIGSLLLALLVSSSIESASTPCGNVGASPPAKPKVHPLAVSNRGIIITVTTNDDLVDGDTSSVAALVSNPGPDGISLREALMAVNNDHGAFTIDFAASLKGTTITVGGGGLPPLTTANLLINGDIDGDSKPDITVTNSTNQLWAFFISSSGITINGLSIRGFGEGVHAVGISPTQTLYANTTISNSVMHSPSGGIDFGLGPSIDNTTWKAILIEGNTIYSSGGSGIVLAPYARGGVMTGIMIANNTVVGEGPNVQALAVTAGGPVNASGFNSVRNLVVYDNSITGAFSTGVYLASGIRGDHDVVDNVTISGNLIAVTSPTPLYSASFGVDITTGDAGPGAGYIRWSVMNDVNVLNNTIAVPGDAIFVFAGCCGAAYNRISSLKIENNVLDPVLRGYFSAGVLLSGSDSGGYYPGPTSSNNLTGVQIVGNTIQMTSTNIDVGNQWMYLLTEGGVDVHGGRDTSGNKVSNVLVSNNLINGSYVGINLFGGVALQDCYTGPCSASDYSASGNSVSSVSLVCNTVVSSPSAVDNYDATVRGINLVGGLALLSGFVAGNSISNVTLQSNSVAGVPNWASVFMNLGSGASGNAASLMAPGNTSSTTSTLSLSSASITSKTMQSSSTPSTSGTSTVTSSSTGGQGIPEFPYHSIILVVVTIIIAASYLTARRLNAHQAL